MESDTRVEWRDWGAEAFETARREGKPVLLSLTATWCATCHEMDATTYAEPRIAANVNDSFVPVRVDIHRRPRVRERYNMGGFPSTVFLTPDGEVLTGATYLGPDGMGQVLDRVRETWDEKGDDAGSVPRALSGDPTPAGELGPEIEEHLAGQLDAQYDEEYAGWGSEAKFPLPRTVEFALKRDRDRALRSLDAVRDHLFDDGGEGRSPSGSRAKPADSEGRSSSGHAGDIGRDADTDAVGGFFRFAGRRDWGDVRYEKVLADNAALVRAFADAYLYTGEDAYRRPADRTVDYLIESLWTGYAFGGSQGPAGGADYYRLGPAERADADGPRTDLTAYAGANALAADALLTYYAYTDDDRAREYGRRTLDYLADELVDDGAVVHYREGDDVGETDALADHARVASAFATAQQVLGEGVVVARSVADRALCELHDEGSFRDGPATGAGLLDRPLRPLDDNVEMADALIELSLLTGEDRYRERARDTVEAFAGAYDRFGAQVAGYGGVAARLLRDPLVVAVADDAGSDLHRAALRVADHEKVVRPGATDAFDPGAAYVLAGSDADPVPAETPRELMARVEDLFDGR